MARAKTAERLGFESVWVTQLPDARDASLVLAAYAAATERLKLGTGVLPIYTRHPTAMAQLAATLDELSGGRFILGIGISHKVTVEGMWGMKLERPVDAMREYLTIVRTSLREGSAGFDGELFTARWAYSAPHRTDLPIMISALNPRMLDVEVLQHTKKDDPLSGYWRALDAIFVTAAIRDDAELRIVGRRSF